MRIPRWLRWRSGAELDEEIQAHLEMEIQANLDRGLSPEMARTTAKRRFGNTVLVKEHARDADPLFRLDGIFKDLRYAYRNLTRTPGFTAVVVITLTIGIGANTAMFSVADALLIRPLPFPEADRLVALLSVNPTADVPEEGRTSYANLLDWQDQSRSFDAITGYRWWTVDLRGNDRIDRLHGLFVTPEFFDVFGVRQFLGRAFAPEDQVASQPAIILARHVWEDLFDSDSDRVGGILDVNTIDLGRDGPTPHRLLGFVTEDVAFPPFTADFRPGSPTIDENIDYWTAVPASTRVERWVRQFEVVGRLRPGVTLGDAQAEMNVIAASLAEAYPDNEGWVVRVVPLHDHALGGTRRALWLLTLCTGLVLLIACGNVASLLLARGVARQREFSVRAALGASRVRIVRQMLTEAGALVLPAAALATLVTLGVLRLLRPFYPSGVPLIPTIDVVSPSVFGFTVAAAIFTTAVAGIVPALKASRHDLAAAIRDGGRTTSPGQSSRRAIRTLVATEVALTLVLLIGAGLMIESANRLLRVNPGFNAANLLTLTISLPANKFDWDHNVTFSRQVMNAIENVPGVQKTAVMQGLPMHPGSFWSNYVVEGNGPMATTGPGSTRVAELPIARLRVVSPGYFDVMEIPLIAGRDFDERDDGGERGTAPYVIVNQTLAQRHWSGQQAIGRRLFCPADCWTGEGLSSRIVGVVDDVKYRGLDSQPEPVVYLPEGRYPQAAVTLLVRTEVAPLNVVADISSRIRQVDNEAFVSDVHPMTDVLSGSIATRRFSTILLASFASVALGLALTAVYGVIRQAVVQRRSEIGIRAALGASPRQVIVLILKYAFRPVAWGLAVGLLGAFLVTPLVSSFLFGVRALDFRIWAAVSLLMLIACLLASYLPARRAASIDPAVVLKAD